MVWVSTYDVALLLHMKSLFNQLNILMDFTMHVDGISMKMAKFLNYNASLS